MNSSQTNFTITAPMSLLVIGECGDGKSSLIKHFSDLTPPEVKKRIFQNHVSFEGFREPFKSPETGSAKRGVTKSPQVFPVMIGNRHCLLYDTPGFGDTDVPPDEIMSMIHNLLDYAEATGRELHGVIVCKTMINRSTMGSQVAGKLTKLAFQGRDNSSIWDHVLLVGTKMDLLRDEDPDEWCDEMLELINEDLDAEVHRVACVNVYQPTTDDRVSKRTGRTIKGRAAVEADVTDLERVIHDFPATPLTFCPISSEDMVKLLNSTFENIDITVHQYELKKNGSWFGLVMLGFTPFFTKTRPLTPLEQFQIRCKPEHELCAFLSSVLYDVTNTEQLASALMLLVGADISYQYLAFSEEPNVYQPAATVISDQTMYVAWRGTKSIMDMIMDLQAPPTHCHLWHDLCPNIKAHNAMKGMIEHNFLTLIDGMQEVIKEYGVTKVVFSGHSLGGGLAQVALLAAFGQCHDKFRKLSDASRAADLYQTFKNIEFSAVTFAAPMVFNFSEEELSGKERECVATLKLCSINYVFGADMVPRMPGHVAYWKPALLHLAKSQVSIAVEAYAGCDVGNAFVEKLHSVKRESYFVNGAVLGTASYATATDTAKELPSVGMAVRERSIEALRERSIGVLHVGSIGMQILAHWFGELAGKIAKKKLKTFLKGLPDDLIQSLKKYKHTAKTFYIDEYGNYEMTDLMDQQFVLNENNKKFLLEHHSVCPNCVGDYMIKRQQMIMTFVKETHFPDTEE